MPIKLALASFYTLGLLFGFLAAIVLSIMYLVGMVNLTFILEATVAINFIIWLIGPYLTDLVHRWFYKMKFLSRETLRISYPDLEVFIKSVAEENKIPFPKIGLIDDDNPTAYTYGSGAFNARIIFTRGLFTYLKPNEINAVIAHELGHIVHRDFIVMSVANTIVQLLYEISEMFLRSHSRGGNSGGKNKEGNGYTVIIGIASYILYLIGLYIVLFLNRTREAFADEFSAKTTKDPNGLANALIKIGYGIIAKEDSARSAKLLESTRALGILGFRTAKEAGLVAQVAGMDASKAARAFLFDLVSPWARLAELGSTHPLTGRRIDRLSDMATAMGIAPLFDLKRVLAENPIDRHRLWSGFFSGVIVYYLPTLVVVIFSLIFIFSATNLSITADQGLVAAALAAFGFSIILKAFYRFPSINNAVEADVLSLMSDPYANPVKGQPIGLRGTVIGRGMAGYVFSEDMMFQDSSGLMYLDYQAGIPLIGNVIFAWQKLSKLFGQTLDATGWFFRSNFQYVVLDRIQVGESNIGSYAKIWNLIMGIFMMGVAMVIGITADLKLLYLPGLLLALVILIVYSRLKSKNKLISDEERAQVAAPSFSWKKALLVVGIVIAATVIIVVMVGMFTN